MSGSSRKVFAVLAALVAVAGSLVLVTLGNAGSGTGTLKPFEGPTNLTTGKQGLAGARFTPTGATNSGSATHIVITIKIPAAVSGSLVVTKCQGGTGSSSGTTATCSIASLQNGAPANMFVTFIAGSSATYPLATEVDTSVSWDNGGGATGQNNSITATPVLYTIYKTDTKTNVFAGQCANSAIGADSIVANDDGTGKGGTVSTTAGVDPGTGFPCLPAYVGVDPTKTLTIGSPGVHTAVIGLLAGGALAQVTLTVSDLSKTGFKWNTIPLNEVLADNTLKPVVACDANGNPPAADNSCQSKPQAKFSGNGVAFFLNVRATGLDPSWTP